MGPVPSLVLALLVLRLVSASHEIHHLHFVRRVTVHDAGHVLLILQESKSTFWPLHIALLKHHVNASPLFVHDVLRLCDV